MSAAPQHPARSLAQQHFDRFVAAHDWSRDHSKIELLYGEIVVTPPAGYPHSVIANNIGRHFGNFVALRRLGQVHASSQGFAMPSGDNVEPDVSFVSNQRWVSVARPEGERYLPVVPDLVVEVLSRSNAAKDRGPKKDINEANGVREYWLVDHQQREVIVFVRDDARGRFGAERVFRSGDRVLSRVLEGLDVSVDDILV
jgi:Uma2 family endonuclease